MATRYNVKTKRWYKPRTDITKARTLPISSYMQTKDYQILRLRSKIQAMIDAMPYDVRQGLSPDTPVDDLIGAIRATEREAIFWANFPSSVSYRTRGAHIYRRF